MTPVIPCSVSNSTFIPGLAVITRNKCFTRNNYSENSARQSTSSRRVSIALPRSVSVFPQLRNGCATQHTSRRQRLSAAGMDVTVEQDSSPAEEASVAGPEEVAGNKETTKPAANAAPQDNRRQRKSEMPPVKNEDLVPGAMFTGKVVSVQPFGAFVDFGAFTNGLVHVSKISDSFVKNIDDVISVGQEVQVRLVEVNTDMNRIALSMRDDDSGKPQTGRPQQRRGSRSGDGSRAWGGDGDGDDSRSSRNFASRQKQTQNNEETNKAVISDFKVGQEISGTVKSVTRAGAYVYLSDSVEGFVPEENGLLGTPVNKGDKIKVSVSGISRGRVTLKLNNDEEDDKEAELLNSTIPVLKPTNPFVLAFRQNKDIAAFLDQREAENKQDISVLSVADAVNEEESAPSGISQSLDVAPIPEEVIVDKLEDTPSAESELTATIQASEVLVEAPENETKAETSIPEGNGSVTGSSGGNDEAPSQESVSKAAISPALVKQLREETGAGMMDCKKALSETEGDMVKAQEYLRKKGLASADKKSGRVTAEGKVGSYIHDNRIGVLIEVNCETDFVARGDIFRELVDDLAMQVAACPQVQYLSTDDVPKDLVDKETKIEMQKEDLLSKPEQIRSKIVEGRVRKRLSELALLEQPYIKNDKVIVNDWVKQTIATIGENIKVKRFLKFNLGEGLERKNLNFAAEVAAQTAAKPKPVPEKEQTAVAETEKAAEKAPAVAVSAALVKQLRDESGAGMMDCKKALAETGGDLEKAQEYLRKKGLSSADNKANRLAAEGRIGSYIHDGRIGVLIEVNCETDFVGRSDNFKELVEDLAMQVAACPQVQYVSIEDIPESIVTKEKQIEMQREDLQSKPENIREKIVEGRISKRLGEVALLEQPFIKNDKILVKDLVKQTVATLGENIKVRRFARFTLGEQTEIPNAESEA